MISFIRVHFCFFDNIISYKCLLYLQSALRYSNQNEFLELEYSDDSSDSEDEMPRDQVLLGSNFNF